MKFKNCFQYNNIIVVLCLMFSSQLIAATQPMASDEYLTGYLQGLFVHSFGKPAEAVSVKNGVVYISSALLSGDNPILVIDKVKKATEHIVGIKQIVLKKKKPVLTPASVLEEQVDGLMPNRSLFSALIADPKWPRFSLAYQYYFENRILKHAFAPNFGASFPFFRGTTHVVDNMEWEIGVQGGLFALMDIGGSPSALVNADYYIGLPISYRSGRWSGFVRVYHLSTHLGDEFMLTPAGKNTTRINLSYEAIDTIVSYQFNKGFRAYGGGGYIVHKDPSYIKPLKVQVGAEYRSLATLFEGRLRPLMGLDIKSEQLAHWTPGISYKVGVEIENSMFFSNEVQLMLEFYKGKSMHGQFFNEKISYLGLGLHAFF